MKPQREVRDVEYIKYTRKLFQAFITFSDSLDAEKFLKELLTESEFLMLKRRWHVACLLNEGYNVREAAQAAKVSTQTVQAVKRALERSQVWKEYLPLKKQHEQASKAESTSTPSSNTEGDLSRKYIFG